jgi:hypothetical protein
LDRNCQITLEIGGMPILLHMQDDSFRQLLALRYAGFVGSAARPKFEFDIELTAPLADDPLSRTRHPSRRSHGYEPELTILRP